MAHDAPTQQRLRVQPITLRAASAFVGAEHRHHPPTTGHIWSTSVVDESGTVRGVAVIGRPTARHLQALGFVEVLRVATDGCPNACSALYGAAARQAAAKGYRRDQVVTFTLDDEPGTSLRAAGWVLDGQTKGGSWSRPSRRREDVSPTCVKNRWLAAPRQEDPDA